MMCKVCGITGSRTINKENFRTLILYSRYDKIITIISGEGDCMRQNIKRLSFIFLKRYAHTVSSWTKLCLSV
jgi:hypothetical protein